ncbi:PREDICTED: auxin-responsive protein IAA8 [Camelina sativa]|uniref:Auxin-responsive protein n=1 Tax=Camelina sativa TaxID=90675 RepID=A0ABM0WK68_CAMSA|nr:PREDICTED: auxin-responsive protein IAA8 [Camelina sativa]
MSYRLLSVDKEELDISPPGLKERNYLGLSDCSSVDSSTIHNRVQDGEKSNLNFKATELRLGLPESQSPERETDFGLLSPRTPDEKLLFPLLPSKDIAASATIGHKNVVSGNKRGFADTWDEFSSVKGSVRPGGGINMMLSPKIKDVPKSIQEERSHAKGGSNNAPAAKAQVVGWPPIRSYRKNTMASSTSKNTDEVDGKPGLGALFVKVSMDGAPYLRKVDLRTYTCYQQLSSALEKMFSCFTLGQCGLHGAQGRERMSETKLKDLLHGSEFVLTYEDKDGDWMLVGDVPWEIFTETCQKLKIMKGSDSIGLAPGAVEKSKNKDRV